MSHKQEQALEQLKQAKEKSNDPKVKEALEKKIKSIGKDIKK